MSNTFVTVFVDLCWR